MYQKDILHEQKSTLSWISPTFRLGHSAWTSTAKMAPPVSHHPCAHAGTKSGRSPAAMSLPLLKDYDTKGVFHWEEHKQKRLHFG